MAQMMLQFKNEIEATNKEMMSAMKEQLKENSKSERWSFLLYKYNEVL